MRPFLFITALFILSTIDAKKKEREVVGCAPIYEDRVFMSTTEASNFNYKEFLYHQKRAGVDVKSLLPDTTVWRTKGAYNEPYVEYYFSHPAYKDYPVVGLTKDQAQQFCDWLSLMLTQYYRANEKSDIDSVVVRLPTKTEWINAAKGGNDYYEYPWKGHSLRIEEGKSKGDIRVNCVRGRGDYMGVAGSLSDMADVTAPVISYWPNDYGLYNCSGNVAEMVADDNVAMGGSWRSYPNNVKVYSEIRADTASAEIGFRYLVEVVKLKPAKKKKSLAIDQKFVNSNLYRSDSILFSRYEVSNDLYNLFLKETKHPVQDTSVWNDQFIYSNYYTCNYRWHSKFGNYPVVGITMKDAEAFCKWMTQKLQPFYSEKIEVDILNEKEWEKGARGDLSMSVYPWGGPYIRNSQGELLGNFRYIPEAFMSYTREGEIETSMPSGKHEMYGADLDGALGTAPVNAYYPNDFGMYNIGGNVRELIKNSETMTDLDKPFTKGGGWNSYDYFLQMSYREFYESLPSADIGLRFVVRILE